MRAGGQAVVELALASLVLVTVMMFGIYFAELSFTPMKVHEAASAALWDSTHYKMHDMGAQFDPTPFAAAAATAVEDANLRYQDFDGRSSTQRTHTFTTVFTQAGNLVVGYGLGTALPFPPNRYVARSYTDNGGLNVQAEADVLSFRLPTQLLDGVDGFFSQPHWAQRLTHVCALGRAQGRTCPASFSMLVDDWGLAEGAESNACMGLPYGVPCANQGFYSAALKTYTFSSVAGGVANNTAATDLAEAVVGENPQSPLDERMFYMSYTGEEMLFQQVVYWPFFAEGAPVWETTPFASMPTYAAAWNTRRSNGGCYLGRNCNSANGSSP